MDIRTPVPTTFGDWLAKFGETWKSQVETVKQRFGDKIEEVRMPPDYPTDVPILYVKKEAVLELLAFLKNEAGFEYNYLADLTATDENVEPRFEIVYNLFSHSKLNRIRVKTRVRDGEEVPSAVRIWPAADWVEREVFDMFGVKFTGHPDLRRILMDIRYQGHPLRKDFPLRNFQIFMDPEMADPKLLD